MEKVEVFPIDQKKFSNAECSNSCDLEKKIEVEKIGTISLKPRTLMAPTTLVFIYFSKSCKLENCTTKSDFKFEN